MDNTEVFKPLLRIAVSMTQVQSLNMHLPNLHQLFFKYPLCYVFFVHADFILKRYPKRKNVC